MSMKTLFILRSLHSGEKTMNRHNEKRYINKTVTKHSLSDISIIKAPAGNAKCGEFQTNAAYTDTHGCGYIQLSQSVSLYAYASLLSMQS